MSEKQDQNEFEPAIVAVYGSLKRGFGNHGTMGDSEFLGEIQTEPKFTLYSLGYYPALVNHGNTSVTCEIYRVTNPRTLRGIYGLEGYNGIRGHEDNDFYDTMDIPTPWGDAEVFIQTKKQNENNPIVKSGNWKR